MVMHDFVPFKQIPPLSLLFKRRLQHLRERLYNLRLDDVDTPERYNCTREFLKNAILIQPIVFGEAIFNGVSTYMDRSMIVRLSSKIRDMIVRQVMLPFTGNAELFGFAAANVMLQQDAPILAPFNGYLCVKLDTIFFNRYDALYAAKSLMRPTLEMISINNESAKEWNKSMERRIDSKLERFRQECIDLYRPNNLLRPATGLE
jgi:hypothetical protein